MTTKRVIIYVALVWAIILTSLAYLLGEWLGYSVVMAAWGK